MMKKICKIVKIISFISACAAFVAFVVDRINSLKTKKYEKHKTYGLYEEYIKRPLDVFLSTGALIVFSPILLVTAILVKFKLGSPVLFTQDRPGKINPLTNQAKIFKLYKFRTMTDEKDDNGQLLSDAERLTSFGKKLRSTSLEGNDIIGQTTESLVNKGFREVSPIHFFTGRDLFSERTDLFDIERGMNLLALNQGREAFRVA